MKLYGHPLSSCTRKVVVVFAEKNTQIDVTTVDLFSGENKTPAHLARHPFGVIPALEDDGFTLYESRAILRYLDARLPGPSLVPAGVKERARMDQWLSVDQSYIAPQVQALVGQKIVRPHLGLESEPSVIDTIRTTLRGHLAIVDRALREQANPGQATFLAGDSFSLADASLMPYVASLGMLDATDLLDDLPALSSWWARVSERPSWNVAVASR